MRPLVLSDWERFNFYVERVRGLSMNARDASEDGLIRAMSNSRRAGTLLPNMLHFSVAIMHPRDLAKAMLFVGPRMIQFSLDKHHDDDEDFAVGTASCLSQLKYSAPSLEHFDFNVATPWSEPDNKSVSWLLCAIPPVRVVHCGIKATHRVFYHLAMMPTLEEVSLDVSDDDGIPPLRHLPITPFTTLRSLDLESAPISNLLDLFESMGRRDFHTLILKYCRARDPSQVQELMSAVNRCASHETLMKLAIDVTPEYDLPVHVHAQFSFQLLQPLSVFQNLRHLHLGLEDTPEMAEQLDDYAIERLAISHPHLETLRVWGDRATSQITLIGLRPLGIHCRCLQVVDMPSLAPAEPPVDVTSGEATTGSPAMITSLPPLSISLGLETDVLGDPKKVARFLMQMFPNIAQISNPRVQYWIDVILCKPGVQGCTIDEYVKQELAKEPSYQW